MNSSDQGVSVPAMAKTLGLATHRLRYYLDTRGIHRQHFAEITDRELDGIISKILQTHPNAGSFLNQTIISYSKFIIRPVYT